MALGDAIAESGMLLRDGGGFVLRGDGDTCWRLDLSRVPVDLVGKRVRVAGVEAGDGLIDVDGCAPAESQGDLRA